jgi:hypothetical protein
MSSGQERPASVGQAGQTRAEAAGSYQQATGSPAGQAQYAPEREVSGGVMAGRVLAGFLMILSGAINFFTGLTAVIRKTFFTFNTTYPYHWSVHGWGWLTLIGGAVIFAAGVCVLLGMVWARAVGIVLATLAAIANFLFIPFYPFWSIVLIALDVFVIWALASSGRRDYA